LASLIDQMNQAILARRNAIAPLVLVAPSTRCGTTLTQRLLTSSGEMLVYGENALLFEVLPQVYRSVLQTFSGDAAARMQALRARVSSGDVDGWIAGLLPEPDRMNLVAARQLVEHVLLMQEDASALGFTSFGLKYPLGDPSALTVLTSLMPKIRVMVIHRHVLDTLSSAKGRGWVEGGAASEAFARSWSENLAWLTDWRYPHKLMVPYAAMVADPDTWLPRMAAFAEIEQIDPGVLDTRVNTFAGTGAGEDPSSYTPPVPLTDAERRRALPVAEAGLIAGEYLTV